MHDRDHATPQWRLLRQWLWANLWHGEVGARMLRDGGSMTNHTARRLLLTLLPLKKRQNDVHYASNCLQGYL